MSTPLWIGDKSTRLDPRCPIYEATKDGPKYTMIYNGFYVTMLANLPARLSNVNGVSAAYFVDAVRLEQQPGNAGKMTLTLIPNPIPDWTFPNNSVEEVEFIEVQKPLKNHPVFNPSTEDSVHPNAGLYALSLDTNSSGTNDWLDIEGWENEGDLTKRNLFQYSATGGTVTLSANAQQYATRVLKGQDSYQAYLPVCRVTKKNTNQPNGTYCGSQTDPPDTVKIDGYVYVQTADRYTHDRTWVEVQEFTGFDSIDTILYPEDGGT